MVDLYLQAMLSGAIVNRKKDKYDEVISKEIKLYVDSLPMEEETAGSQLVSPKMKRNRLIEVLTEEVKMTELAEHIEKSLSFIRSEGAHYLERLAYERLLFSFQKSRKLLDQWDLKQELTKDYQEMMGLSNEEMGSVYQIANGAYKEERYEASLSLFVFLAALQPSNPDYWFRMGIAAEKNNLMDQALKAYEITNSLVPEFIGARLLAAQVYFLKDLSKEAKEQVDEAKKIKEKEEIEPVWLDLLATLETLN